MQLVEADLLKPESWPVAISGCTYVCHTASSFVFGVAPEDEGAPIKPAVDGTVNVLKPSKADKVQYKTHTGLCVFCSGRLFAARYAHIVCRSIYVLPLCRNKVGCVGQTTSPGLNVSKAADGIVDNEDLIGSYALFQIPFQFVYQA